MTKYPDRKSQLALFYRIHFEVKAIKDHVDMLYQQTSRIMDLYLKDFAPGEPKNKTKKQINFPISEKEQRII